MKTKIVRLALTLITSSVLLGGCTFANIHPEEVSTVTSEVASEATSQSGLSPDWEAPSQTDNPDGETGTGGQKEAGKVSLPAMKTPNYASDGENIYYREYTAEDFSDPVYLYFSDPFVQNAEAQLGHKLHVMKPDGSIETITDFDPGFGRLCYAGGRIFSQGKNIIDMDYLTRVYYVNIDEEYDYTTLDDYDYVFDAYGDYVICEKRYEPSKGLNGGNSIIDAVTLKEVTTVDGFYLGADKNGVYTYQCSEGTRVNPEDMFVNIYLTDYDGNTKLIGEIGQEEFSKNESYYTDGVIDYGLFEIPVFQIMDDIVVFNVGYYSGTGHFFSGGVVCFVMKQGGAYYVCNNDFEGFVCTETPDAVCVSVERYDYDAGDYVTETYSIAGGIAEAVGYTGEKPGEAFVERGDNPDRACKDVYGNEVELKKGDVGIYNGYDGVCTRLLTREETEALGYNLIPEDETEDDGPRTEIYNVEYVGDKLFFTISYMKRQASEDIGWRYAYRHSLSTDFVKDLSTGEITVLAEYGPDNS